MKNVLFLFRSYADLDHMVPLLHKAMTTRKIHPIVACTNIDFDFTNDFRIKHIKSIQNVNIDYLFNYNEKQVRVLLLNITQLLILRATFFHKIPLVLKTLLKLRFMLIKQKQNTSNWFASICKQFQIRTVVVDFTNENRTIYSTISSVCASNQIPVIGVPHGFDFADNTFWTNDALEKQNKSRMGENWGWINHLLVPSTAIKNKYSSLGLKKKNITSLGSPRFCQEWMQIYHSLVGTSSIYKDPSKLKVLYIDHSSIYRANPDSIVETLSAINTLGCTDLKIKPHIRALKNSLLSDERMYSVGSIDDSHTIHLIQWADVVINCISSVILEALYLNKIFMYPSYFNQNDMRWSKFGSCWEIKSKHELINALSNIFSGDYDLPYNQTDIDHFFESEIYAGDRNNDVLGNYIEHIFATTDI